MEHAGVCAGGRPSGVIREGRFLPRPEGVAIHGGPESCVGVREGVGEALTGVRVGQAIEPRNQGSGVPTSLTEAEGNIAGGAKREPSADPARSKNLGMHGISMREKCAVRRFVVSPAQPGGTWRNVPGSTGLPSRESSRGQEHAGKADGRLEASRAALRKTRAIWPKLNCLMPNLQG